MCEGLTGLSGSLVVCTVWDQLFAGVVSCSVVVEDFRFTLLRQFLMKTVTSTKKSWCAALPTRKRKIKAIASSNRIDSRLLLHQVQKAILHATHQSPHVDQLNITEVQISMGKKCWQIQLNGKNQPNHSSEPAEPLDSPHESPISKRKICSRRSPHELSCGYSQTCAIFSHLVPGPLRKLQ